MTAVLQLLSTHPLYAQSPPPTAPAAAAAALTILELIRLQSRCTATATRKIQPDMDAALASRLQRVALDEFDRFDGHVIDSSGRIARFGSVESERARDRAWDDYDIKLQDIPWRRVASMWERMHGSGAIGKSPPPALTASMLEGALASEPALADASDMRAKRIDAPLWTLLKSIDQIQSKIEIPQTEVDALNLGKRQLDAFARIATKQPGGAWLIDNGRLQEVLRESVMRASINDVAWSAAFISAVLRSAQAPEKRFRFSASHVIYIQHALDRSLRELRSEGTPPGGLSIYRACDIYGTAARAGDLVCYLRDGKSKDDTYQPGLKGSPLFAQATRDFVAEGGELPFNSSHCDVVVGVDRPSARIVTTGGNVNQAVTKRLLRINPKTGAVSANQGRGCPAVIKQLVAGTSVSPDDQPKSNSCNLNDQRWFALLQLEQ